MSIASSLAKGRAIGVDLSHHNDNVDFHAMKAAGVSFVALKVSEGMWEDPAFQDHLKRARSADLLIRPYHFYRPPGSKPVGGKPVGAASDQVKFFLKTIGGVKGYLLPAVDLELDDNERTLPPATYLHGSLAWCQLFKQLTGHAPEVYSYKSFWSWLGNPKEFGAMGCSEWVAAYKGNQPVLPGFTNWSDWQVSDRDDIPGVGKGDVDSDLFRGTVEELKKLVLA